MTARVHVSVVMSVYNGADLLETTLDSVLAQTAQDFEFIIVNDGSSDRQVLEILRRYAHRDERLRVLEKQNEGLTKALIDGCRAANGHYIARIDAGDVMLPTRLEKQARVLDHNPEIVWVSAWTEYCGPEWEPLFTRQGHATPEGGMLVLSPEVNADVLAGPTHHGSVMFRRAAYQAAGGYRPAFYFGQDWDLWYRLAEQGRFYLVPEVLYRVRLHSSGLSGINRKKQEALGRLSREAMRQRRLHMPEDDILRQASLVQPDVSRKTPRHAEAGVCYMVGEALRRRNDPRSLIYLKRSVQLQPWHPKAWLRLAQAWKGGFT